MIRAFSQLASAVDALGMRRPLAAAASLLVRCTGRVGQRFSVDQRGNWVNELPDAVFVSPRVYHAAYPAIERWVHDLWLHDYVPKPGDIVFDVGAGIGEDAIIFSRLVGPTGLVIAIEAHPETFACLEQTIARSGTSNVIPVRCAAADHDGTVLISDRADHYTNTIVGTSVGCTVPAMRLDAIASKLGIETVDFLKMNIEGGEKLAVRGMEELSARIRHLCISCHDFVANEGGPDDQRTRDEVSAFLLARGFRLSTRPEDPRSSVRHYVYGRRSPADGRADQPSAAGRVPAAPKLRRYLP